ncbi:MAG: polysaccharide pyruvyl transferase family protein [Thermoleophilaceae bacterium]
MRRLLARNRAPDPDTPLGSKLLVAGWFSWASTGATAGDLLARDVVSAWLDDAGIAHDVADDPALGDGVDFRKVDPSDYGTVLFVCGPVGPHTPIKELLDRFPRARHIGLDLSMIPPLGEWNPFDELLERDSTETARADVVFASPQRQVPVVAAVLVEPYTPEYPDADRQEDARHAALRLLASRELAVIEVDTRLPVNESGLRTPAEVESAIARADVVVTTRLHGLVLALKNGVPVVAFDVVAGGAKIAKQAGAIGWPHVLLPDDMTDEAATAALDACLSEDGRRAARECAQRAAQQVEAIRAELLGLLEAPE